jgi:putative glycosyltransferase (TIGR04372 family)
MKIRELTFMRIMHGVITMAHIPLLLVIYAIHPFIKLRFGYFSTDRIGHFALDLGYAIALNKNKNENEINLYYLQDDICNSQLEVIAKRELNVSQYYKYFVYAYKMLGLNDHIILPHRHKSGSRDMTGIMINSDYNISLLPSENKEAELYMKKYGWTQGEKFICINVRDSAFFNESQTSRHIYRNSNIEDYEVVVNYLLDLGYWVVRMGKKVEKPINIKDSKLIDYGIDQNRSDLLDVWFCKNCECFVSTGTGVDSVAMMFKKKIVFVNYMPINFIISWVENITVPKRLFWNNGKELTLAEHLDVFLCYHNRNVNQCKEKGINVVDLSPNEIKSVVQEMIARLNGVPLTSEQVGKQKKFWNILEKHKSYSKFHGVRDPNASFGTSFIDNNQDFLK